jgi:hydrogenase maturation protease
MSETAGREGRGTDRLLVIGVGNPACGDDGAGRELVRRLRQRLAESSSVDVDLAECDGGAADLLDLWQGRDRVVLVDACRGGGAPGTLHVFDAVVAPLPADLLAADARASSHGHGPAQAVELGRALGRLPRRLTVYAIEVGGLALDPGDALDPLARHRLSCAVERTVESLATELSPA